MDILRGLERVSVVLWILCALIGALLIGMGLAASATEWGLVMIGLAIVAVSYLGHLVTCWVVRGFFGASRAP
jgi:hypothetical protein